MSFAPKGGLGEGRRDSARLADVHPESSGEECSERAGRQSGRDTERSRSDGDHPGERGEGGRLHKGDSILDGHLPWLGT